MSETNRHWRSGMLSTEDWWAVWLGLIMFAAGLTSLWGVDLVGWATAPRSWEWTSLIADFTWGNLFAPASNDYAGMGALGALALTFVVFTGLLTVGAYFQGLEIGRFIIGFTVIFVITWIAWTLGNEAHFSAIDATVGGRNRYAEYGLTWGLQLGADGTAYIFCLAAGLVIGNFFKGFAEYLNEAAKPEWFIKTAIVYLGIKLGVMTMEATEFALELLLAGAAATFIAYLFFWPIIYTLARRTFRLQRDVSAVLASGISICGVSAAIATAGAIRARPTIPVAISMLVVIFAMIELVVLPGLYTTLAPDQPIVNGAAMGMTVKTDGADAAAGALLDELMIAGHVQQTGELWQEGWILSAAILTKIWIDVFIGIWAFLLALLWVYKVERAAGRVSIGISEIWFRFPKFVIGYFVAWLFYVAIAVWFPERIADASMGADIVQGPMRKLMFMLTFVSIGLITDFSKLKGMGRLALLYAVALGLIIAPLAYVIAWLFHRGLVPPLAA
jgi:uncharacterized membrane protein YadS